MCNPQKVSSKNQLQQNSTGAFSLEGTLKHFENGTFLDRFLFNFLQFGNLILTAIAGWKPTWFLVEVSINWMFLGSYCYNRSDSIQAWKNRWKLVAFFFNHLKLEIYTRIATFQVVWKKKTTFFHCTDKLLVISNMKAFNRKLPFPQPQTTKFSFRWIRFPQLSNWWICPRK